MKKMHILIFRPDNIGDVLLFSGALEPLRNLFPEAHITLGVQAGVLNMMELCPHVDRCISINDLTWRGRMAFLENPALSGPGRIIRYLNRLWNRCFAPFDLIIYPVKSPQVAHLQLLSELRADRVIGMAGCSLNEPSGGYPVGLLTERLFTEYLDVSGLDPWRHELLTTLDFLRYLGCEVSTTDEILPAFWLPDGDDSLLPGGGEGETIIGIFPGGSSREKCWPPANYYNLARLMDFSPHYVIFGGASDGDLSREVASSFRKVVPAGKVTDMTGQTSLQELIKCIRSCDLCIGMDSSALHMAVAADVPSIGIVGGWHYGRFVPWGNPDRHIFLTHEMSCFNCKRPCSDQSVACVEGVTPEEVAVAVNDLLKQIEVPDDCK